MSVALTIYVPNLAALRRGIAGLRSTDDDGEALLSQLERLASPYERAVPYPVHTRRRVPDATVRVAYVTHEGNLSAMSRELDIARSTIRARIAKMRRAGTL